MRIPRRYLAVSLSVVVLFLLASGIYVRIRGADESEEATAGATDGEVPVVSASAAFATDVAIPVEGAPVVRDTLVLSVTAAGQAAAWQQTVVKSRVDGRIEELPVRESEAVGAGELLLQIEPTEYELEVAQARATLAQADATYRELTLFDDRIEDAEVRAERARVARAKSGLAGAEVALRVAELNLERTQVLAPFGGRVASIQVGPGEWVTAGVDLMTIVHLDPIKVEVQVLDTELANLAPGRRARVQFAAYPGEPFIGRIETINPMVDPETRTAKVTVAVPNPGGRILPGMYAQVSLEARRFPDRILVPRAAILERDQRTMLFVYEGDERGGLSKWRYVTTGLQNDSLVEIVPGEDPDRMVEPGEFVLVDGHYSLIHDARVRLVEDVVAAGGRPN